jgi:hypothetical protein
LKPSPELAHTSHLPVILPMSSPLGLFRVGNLGSQLFNNLASLPSYFTMSCSRKSSWYPQDS